MESVGSILRSERLRQGVGLEEVSAETRVSVKHLRAIESDDIAAIHGAFFYRSFVRQFAAFLGLPPEVVSTPLAAAMSAVPEPMVPGQRALEQQAVTPKVPALRPSRPKKLRSVYSVLSLVVMLAACSTLHALWQHSRAQLQTSAIDFVKSFGSERSAAPAQITQVPTAQPATVDSARVITQASAARSGIEAPPPQTNAAAASSATAAEPENAFRVEVSALEPAWLSIISDGKQIYSGMLAAAQTKILQGREMARIRTGNAGALNVLFNGRSIGTLGPRGQVRTVVFTRDNYEILGTTTAAIALASFTPTGE